MEQQFTAAILVRQTFVQGMIELWTAISIPVTFYTCDVVTPVKITLC